MKHRVVLISGKQGSGKSSLQKAILGDAIDRKFSVLWLNFADPLYEMHDACLKIISRAEVSVPKKDGKLLQWLGTEWGRQQYGQNVWVDIARNRIREFQERQEYVHAPPWKGTLTVIGDARFPNEIDFAPNITRIRLECSEKVRRERIEATPGQNWRDNTNHPSETALDAWDGFDVVIPTDKLNRQEALAVALRVIYGVDT